MTNAEILRRLYALVGERAVLIHLPLKQKSPEGTRWTNYQLTTFEMTQEPEYQEKLNEALNRKGNLAVLLGPRSENLCAIDIDHDAFVSEFFKAESCLARYASDPRRERVPNLAENGWRVSASRSPTQDREQRDLRRMAWRIAFGHFRCSSR